MSDAEHPEATVYHLCRAPEWAEAERTGIFHGSAPARADGYLHFSTAAQARESAARHRAGIADLLLIAAESAALGPALRWEPASGGRRPGLFPHLYGPLPLAAVRGVFPLALGPDGRHVFPSFIP